jgi:hypothetical protein
VITGDRIISTAAVTEVPYAWVAQPRPGGLVLTPWATAYYPGGLLSLTVEDDGTATGGIIIETAHQWWINAGKPGLPAWRFTITPDGQRIEQTTPTPTPPEQPVRSTRPTLSSAATPPS